MTENLIVPDLTTERLHLEPLSHEHAQGMFTLWSDARVCEYSGEVTDCNGAIIDVPVKIRNDSDRIIDFWHTAQHDGWGMRWAILLGAGTRTFAGTIGFNALGNHSEIAFHLVPNFWGQGIMTEAAHAAIDWAAVSGAQQICAFIEDENINSIKLVQRLGMQKTNITQDGGARCYVKKI